MPVLADVTWIILRWTHRYQGKYVAREGQAEVFSKKSYIPLPVSIYLGPWMLLQLSSFDTIIAVQPKLQ